MTPEEKREHVIQGVANLLRCNSFTFEYKVKKKPQGIKVIFEVTQETMDMMLKKAAEKEGVQ